MSTYAKLLKLKAWEQHFSKKIHPVNKAINLRAEFEQWAEMNDLSTGIFEQFFRTATVRKGNGGQCYIVYTETNGRRKEIRPVFRYYPEITLENLYGYAKAKSKEFWNREFTGEIILTKKYYSKLVGSYSSEYKYIKMSEHLNARIPNDLVYDTLLHELVHWHLHTSDKPYDDTDFEFIEECLKRNIGLSGAPDAQAAYQAYKILNKVAQ